MMSGGEHDITARLMLWAVAVVMALCGAVAAAPVRAEPIDDRGCAYFAPAGRAPAHLFAAPPNGCDKAHDQPRGRNSYVIFSGLDRRTDAGDALEFSYRLGRADFQRVYFRFADGAVVRAAGSRDAAFRPLTDQSLYFAVPARPAALTDIVVEGRGFENAHGLATRARLGTHAKNLARAADLRLYHGLIGGAVIAMLVYNFLLWPALRYRFLLVYCALGAAILGFGTSWTGAIWLLLPGMTINAMIGLNYLFYTLTIALFACFVVSMLDPPTVPRWLRRALAAWSAIGLAVCGLRLAGWDGAWRLIDFGSYAALLVLMGLALAAIGYGLRTGNRMMGYFLVAWSLPIGVGIWRTLWAVGLFQSDGVIHDFSPFGVMAVEMMLSALGIAARIRALRIERDDAQSMRAMLEYRADTDSLSGLLNRRAFLERAGARTADQQLVLIDVDQFKTVNDRFGHEAGDRVVAEIGRLLMQGCPPGGVVGRLGGDEFAVLVEAHSSNLRLADRLLLQIAYAPMPIHSMISASAGTAIGPTHDEASWRALYNAADEALYDAKSSGRNCARPGAIVAAA